MMRRADVTVFVLQKWNEAAKVKSIGQGYTASQPSTVSPISKSRTHSATVEEPESYIHISITYACSIAGRF